MWQINESSLRVWWPGMKIIAYNLFMRVKLTIIIAFNIWCDLLTQSNEIILYRVKVLVLQAIVDHYIKVYKSSNWSNTVKNLQYHLTDSMLWLTVCGHSFSLSAHCSYFIKPSGRDRPLCHREQRDRMYKSSYSKQKL